MEIKIVLDNLDLLEIQKELIEKKLKILEKYLKRYSFKELVLTLGQREAQEKGKIFWAQVKVALPGKDLVFQEEAEDINILINLLKKELKNQLIDLNKKRVSQIKRWARVIKEKFFH